MADYGYARVSTKPSRNPHRQQRVENQVDRLLAAGIARKHIFTDRFEGRWEHRPQWDLCLAALKSGDTLVCTKLDRLGRSVKNLIDVAEQLQARGVSIRMLDQGEVDYTTPQGRLQFHMLAVLAEFESDMARERVAEGMVAAREKHGGALPLRGPGKDTQAKLAKAQALIASGVSKSDAAKAAGISRASLYRLQAAS